MSKFYSFILLAGCAVSMLSVTAQSDDIPMGNKQYQLLNRLDIKLRNDSILSSTTIKPYNRKLVTERIQYLDSLYNAGTLPITLSAIDRYNIRSLLMNNAEWTTGLEDSFKCRRPIFGKFYTTPAHLYQSYSKDFVLVLDPVLNLQTGKSSDLQQKLFTNTRGVSVRGRIGRNVGFYSYVTDNQQRNPLFIQQYVAKHYGVPGAGYYKYFHGDGYDYFDARGGVDIAAGKYFNFRFGYDKLFIGDGYRSLMLSDFGNSYLHLQMNARINRFNYRLIYAELIAPFDPSINRDTVRFKNYLAIHHLGVQLNKWLTVGLYENVIYNGKNGIELSYLNPAIFYRSTEMQLGSGNSKATVGFDIKANIPRNLQWYGQLFIGEFVMKEILQYGRGSWVNKQAVQLGGKYIDAFGLKNLDLQGEFNWVRPFVYQHNDSSTAFTHYNLPLAHPAGANFREFIGIAQYQPAKKWYFSGKMFYRIQGQDSLGVNMGGDIFRSYDSRPRDYGFNTGGGIRTRSLLVSCTTSYELLENLFIEFNGSFRYFNARNEESLKTSFFSIGIRRNIGRRDIEL